MYFTRNIEFEDTFELFFISAIVAILGIRIFLELTNYPILGGSGLHIAHMLWGGALMAVSIMILITFLSRSIKKLSAVVGGLGFGTFIDELGKFLTSNNDYFFQPTFAIIYVIFILIYIIFYSFSRYWKFTSKEYLVNSLEYVQQSVIKDLNKEEKELALSYLLKSEHTRLTEAVGVFYEKLNIVERSKPNLITKLRATFSSNYFKLIKKSWFADAVAVFFMIQALVSIFLVLISLATLFIIFFTDGITAQALKDNTLELLNLFASAISGIFVIWGVSLFRASRLKAYRKFKIAILISIFVIQILSFYQNQLGAFSGLMFDVLVLITLNYMIKQEVSLHS